MHPHTTRSYMVVVAAYLVLSAGSAMAADELYTKDTLAEQPAGNGVVFSAIEQYVYDNNLYRLPTGTADLDTLIGPGATFTDDINTVTARAKGQWAMRAQSVGFDLIANENKYSRNNQLNNTSGSAKAVWDWQVGPRWLNEVGTDFSRNLASFANNKFFQKDLVDQTEYFGNTRFLMGSHWNIITGLRSSEVEHSADALNYDRYHSRSESIGVEYTSPANNIFSWNYLHRSGSFPKIGTLDGLPFNPDYNESSSNFGLKYFLSADAVANATYGYLTRSYPDSDQGAFSGPIWSASLGWQATAKTQMSLNGLRELTANIEAESNYYVSTGGSANLAWNMTEKITFSINAGRTNQNYINASIGNPPGAYRQDKIQDEQAQVEFSPRDWITLRIAVTIEHRASNFQTFQYNDKLGTIRLTGKF